MQGDPYLFHTPDGGDIQATSQGVTSSSGLETAAYLSLFGGNSEDDGTDTTFSWWGNLDEPAVEKHQRSKTQHILQSYPLRSSALRTVEQAVRDDLAWMLSSGVASKIEVTASIPRLNNVTLSVTIEAQGKRSDFEFTANWGASL